MKDCDYEDPETPQSIHSYNITPEWDLYLSNHKANNRTDCSLVWRCKEIPNKDSVRPLFRRLLRLFAS